MEMRGSKSKMLQIVLTSVEMVASNSKMLQIAPKCCKYNGKWELHNAANGKENGQNRKPRNNQTEQTNPQTILDPT